VVSLVPSATETLAAWGVEPVACTRFCERPDLPHVGGTKNPDVPAIAALRPDVVVLDRQENRREDAAALDAAGIRTVVLDVRSVAGLAGELETLARAVGAPEPTVVVPELAPLGVRAVVPIWRRPWMTIGADTYGSAVLAVLGVVNVYADARVDYPEFTLADAAARGADVVLVPSEPYEFTDAHLAELDAVAPAIRVDGQDLFWWGSRTSAAIARLHAALVAARAS